MLRTWIATVLNFFLPGAGYLVNGRRVLLGIGFLLGAIGLTYVEQSIKPLDSSLYWTMFAAVFVMNTAFAVDAFREGKALMAERGRQAPSSRHDLRAS